MARVMLQWTLRKWLMRCDMMKCPEEEFDHGKLLERCDEWWSKRTEKRLLRTDMHLTRDSNKPQIYHSTEYLRGWLNTRELAEKAFQRYEPGKKQPTIHKWLVRREG